jgi:RimJ/RimL family protein N-acetyltransferase
MLVEPSRIALALLTPQDAQQTLIGQRRAGQGWARDYPMPVDVDLIRSVIFEHEHGITVGPFSHYQVELRDTGLVIGGAGFLSPPDEFGAVEITFGIVPDFIGNGYGAEVVAALVDIAAKGGAEFVIASTKVANIATQSTLRSGGLDEVVRDETTVHFAAVLAGHSS